MALLSNTKTPPQGGDRPVKTVLINGLPKRNSAARFWLSLLSELQADFPSISRAQLSATTAVPIHPDCLAPSISIPDDIFQMSGQDLRNAIECTISELEFYGEPAPVLVRGWSHEQLCLETPLPSDCADSDLFPFLTAWPLEWADIPHNQWSRFPVKGGFTIRSLEQACGFSIEFLLTQRSLSEGLSTYSFDFRYSPFTG